MPTCASPCTWATRAGDVVGPQPLVERQALRVRHQLGGRAALEAAVPERRAPASRGLIGGLIADSPPGRAAEPRAPAPHRVPLRPRTATCRRRPPCRARPSRFAAVERRGHHVRAAGWRAQHDQVAAALHLGHPLAHDPAQLVLRREPGRLVLGDRVHGLAAGHAHLHGTEVLQVARHRGLRGGDALGASRSTSCGWLVTACLPISRRSPAGAAPSSSCQRTPIRKASAPRAACSRL
jgi:hypothetical protein